MYRYGDKTYKGHAIHLFYDPDAPEEAYSRLSKAFAEFTSLKFRSGHAAYPRNYRLFDQDNEDLLLFSLDDWATIAYEVDQYGTPLFALIGHLGGLIPAYVVDLSKGEIAVALFEEYAVLSAGQYYSLSALRELFDDPDYVPNVKPSERILPPIDRQEAEPTNVVVQGYFQSTAKKRIKNLGFAKRWKDEEEEEGEDAPPAPLPSSFAPSFTPSTSKKPKKITGPTDSKPSSSFEPFRKPSFEAKRKTEIPNLVANPNYRKPSNQRTYAKSISDYDLKPSLASHKCRYYQLVGSPENFGILSRIEKELAGKRPEFDPSCLYCPRVIDLNDPVFDLLSFFDPADYAILACLGNQAKVPSFVLLRHIETPYFYLVVRIDRRKELPIVAYSSIDVTVNNGYVSGDFLYSIYEKEHASAKKEEAVSGVEPGLSPDYALEPPADPQPDYPDSPFPSEPEVIEEEEPEVDFDIKEERRLFRSFRFNAAFAKLLNKHPEAEAEIAEMERKLLIASEPSLVQYLSSRNLKQIKQIHKFRLKGGDYAGSRVFFIRGADCKRYLSLENRNFRPSDFILLDLIPHEDHDRQGEAANQWERRLNENRPLQLERVFLDLNKKKTDSLAYPSDKQFGLLRSASLVPPVAFTGSAGTGKTILSLQNCLDLQGNGKVLYLTYEPALRDYAQKKLTEMGCENIDCYTYAELALDELGGTRLAGEGHFHSYYASYLDKRPRLARKMSGLSESKASQASRVYLFLRGVMFGSAECASNGKLTREQFLSKMEDEPSIEKDIASLIYEIGLAYDRDLSASNLHTDNQLAYRLIRKRKRAHSYDAVVLDEYQDLTELQFISLLPYLGTQDARSLNLFLYGDENQCVNPTIFSLSRANAALTEHFHRPFKISALTLDGSYRSGPNLLAFINKLNAIKKKAIGAQKQELDAEEKSLREDQNDLFVAFIKENDRFADIVKVAASSDSDIVFLFPSPSSCEEAKKRLSSVNDDDVENYIGGSFLSVGEAKGREWDSVVLVDFLTEFGAEFALCLDGGRESTHASTVHRMMFNRLYVGLTRARNRILLFESAAPEASHKKLLDGLEPLSFDDYRFLFSDIVDPKHWIAHGKRLLAERDYLGAKRAFERVKQDPVGASLLKIAEDYVHYEDCLNRRDPSHWQSGYSDFLLTQNDLSHLYEFYKKMGFKDKADLLHYTHASSETTDVVGLFRKVVEKSTYLEKAAFFEFSCKKLAKKIKDTLKGDANNGKRR